MNPGFTRGGSLVINLIIISVLSVFLCNGSSLNISETALWSFLKLCMKLGISKVKKSDTAGILRKISIRVLMGQEFMGGTHTPLRSFLIFDFVFKIWKMFFASVIRIISGVSGKTFSDKWKVASVAPQMGGVQPPLIL